MQKPLTLLETVALTIVLLAQVACGRGEMPHDVIACNDVFSVSGDSVVEGIYRAYAPDRHSIVSNYVDTLSWQGSSPIAFRLAFNMRDNEMAWGLFHYIDAAADTVTVTACVPDTLARYAVHAVRPDWHCTLRVDLRQMLSDFSSKGVWVTAKGDSIFSDEFNGVWVIGTVKPLSWDLLPLARNNRLKLRPSEREGFYELDINFAPTDYVRACQFTGWKGSGENKTFPKVHTADVLADALYNMAVETIDRADFSLMNLSELSLSSLLVLAEAKPELCMQLLRSKVEGGMICQDLNGRFTFPVVNDRLIWACAAWQVYLATGNRRWLKYAHKVILATVEQIEQVSLCQTMHLVHGCDSYSSPELQYPRWMQPTDYYESLRLSTNAIYARCLYVLSLIDEELFLDSEQHYLAYKRVKDSINQTMWNESLGRYSSFLIDEVFARQSNVSCNLAQAACVLFDIADDDRATTLVARSISPASPQSIRRATLLQWAIRRRLCRDCGTLQQLKPTTRWLCATAWLRYTGGRLSTALVALLLRRSTICWRLALWLPCRSKSLPASRFRPKASSSTRVCPIALPAPKPSAAFAIAEPRSTSPLWAPVRRLKALWLTVSRKTPISCTPTSPANITSPSHSRHLLSQPRNTSTFRSLPYAHSRPNCSGPATARV